MFVLQITSKYPALLKGFILAKLQQFKTEKKSLTHSYSVLMSYRAETTPLPELTKKEALGSSIIIGEASGRGACCCSGLLGAGTEVCNEGAARKRRLFHTKLPPHPRL